MKFFLDANMPYSSVEVVKELGHVCIHAYDVGLGGATDEEILFYAKKIKAILITKDLDFGMFVVNFNIQTYGIVILRPPFTFTAIQIKSILNTFLKTIKLSNLRSAITIVELGRYRSRKLL